MRWTISLGLLGSVALGALAGCQTGGGVAALNPFFRPERTTFVRPAERIEGIRQIADRSTGQDTPEQQAIVRELVASLAKEDDPLIRETILRTTSRFKTPLASQALLAGLADADPNVRQASCKMVAANPSAGAAEALARLAQGDDSFDVRVAAAKSLGSVGARKEQLLPILEDPDPAMQLAGVEAMRAATGQDLGRDVAAYRALARGETPASVTPKEPTAVANRLPDWVPFF